MGALVMRLVPGSVLALCMLAVTAAEVRADSITGIGFTRVTSNNVENVAGQLRLDILDASSASSIWGISLAANQLLFVYTNNVGIASSISEIYIDDGTVVSQAAVHNSLGGFTRFTGGGANPGNLPGGNLVSPPFIATAGFAVDAVGNPNRGVDTSSDVLGISFVVNGGLSGMQAALADGTLRVGIHVRAIGAAGGSDSFVNTSTGTQIPEPTLIALLAIGLVGIRLARRRRRA